MTPDRQHGPQGYSSLGVRDCTQAVASSGPLPANAPGELNVAEHEGDALGVDGAQIGVFEQLNEVRLTSLLEGPHRQRLEAQPGTRSSAVFFTRRWKKSFLTSTSVFF